MRGIPRILLRKITEELVRAIVCGGGIAGLTASWWLGNWGWDVLLVERSRTVREAGYMIDFFGSGYDVAERMGLLPRLRSLNYPMGRVLTVDGHGKPGARLDYDLFSDVLHGRLLDLMRGDLERVLSEALPAPVEARYGTSIDAIEQTPDTVAVTLADGTIERADVLIGADGIHSRVRSLVFGDETQFLKYLGYHTAAYLFEDDAVAAKLEHGVQLVAEPGRHAGLYPIRGGKIAAFFVYRSDRSSIASHACVELHRVYAGVGGLLPRALEHCRVAKDVYIDVVAQITMPRWTDGRVALIGDACCAVSLVAGQGASIAMGSAYVLATSLGSSASVEEALVRYERQVRPVVERKQASGRRTAEWVFPTKPFPLAIRNLVFRLGQLPGLRFLLRPLFAVGKESLANVAIQKMR
jgi:2-polyprenyl-6-methoxyphenol hydroxylase-like FAD-dependent oxidoreductase